jgi:hypothetical protein
VALGAVTREQAATLLGVAAGGRLAAGRSGLAAGRGRLAARSGLFADGSTRGRLTDRGGLAARSGLFAADRGGLAAGRLASRLAAIVLVATAEQTGLGLNASRQDNGHSNSESENVLHLWFLPAMGLAV